AEVVDAVVVAHHPEVGGGERAEPGHRVEVVLGQAVDGCRGARSRGHPAKPTARGRVGQRGSAEARHAPGPGRGSRAVAYDGVAHSERGGGGGSSRPDAAARTATRAATSSGV